MRRYRLHRPFGRWVLLAVCLVTLYVSLVVDAQFARATIPPSSGVGSALVSRAAGPVLDASKSGLSFTRVPRRTAILTFDGGPDPSWTPPILALLRREHVPATFFVLGSNAARHPALVRAEIKGGNEIGVQTFRPVDLGAQSAMSARAEFSLSEATLAGAAGIHTALLRPTYVATAAQLTKSQLARLREASGAGFVVILANHDSRDWERPGVKTITENAVPRHGEGTIIQLHDGGGRRDQTLAATAMLIARLRDTGYHFTTVARMLGLSPAGVMSRARGLPQIQGRALLTTLRIATWVRHALDVLVILVAMLTLGRAALVLAGAIAHRCRRNVCHTFTPSVSAIVPAYNEEVGIAATVRGLLGSGYQSLEVIVVDDGSSDGTADAVRAIGDPRVVLLRGPGAGKSHALNHGLKVARHDIIVTVDADTIVQPGALTPLVQPFHEPQVGAVSGNVKVGQRHGLLARWQHLEYVVGANLDRRCLDLVRCMPTVPGAIGAYRRKAIEQAGGFSHATLAEDTDLTLAMGRSGWHIKYAPEAVAYTEVPGSLHDLWRQRCRWAYGITQSVWKHRRALRPRRTERSRVGTVGLPYLALFQVLLPLAGPAVDLFAISGLLLHRRDPIVFWFAFLAVQCVLALTALIIEGESLRSMWILPAQQVVHRQLTYLACHDAIIRASRGSKARWNKVSRSGHLLQAPTPGVSAGTVALALPLRTALTPADA